MCCAVLGICRSIWNKFRFDCCGQCSTTKILRLSSEDFLFGGGTGLEQQRRRPPPAAETGSRGWDSVLIFQSPAKGLRKNQQTQPVQAPAVRFRQGSQRLGMSTGMTAVLWWAVQDENRNEQRQGITMVVVSCLLLFLIEYGILGSVQQICIWRIESCGMN